MINKTQLIDEDTGEIISAKYQKWAQRWDESKGYKVPYNILGCKTFTCLEYPSALNDIDIGKFHRLQKWCMRDTHLIGYRSHGVIRAMTPAEIYDHVSLSERRGREWLAKMIQTGMIAKVTVKWMDTSRDEYYTNPAHGLNGQWLSPNLFIMFQESLSKVLAPWEVNKFLQLAREIETK